MKNHAVIKALAVSALFTLVLGACGLDWTNNPTEFFRENTLAPFLRGLEVPAGRAAPGPDGAILIPPGNGAITLRMDNPRRYGLIITLFNNDVEIEPSGGGVEFESSKAKLTGAETGLR